LSDWLGATTIRIPRVDADGVEVFHAADANLVASLHPA
jgi:hypothetical protein